MSQTQHYDFNPKVHGSARWFYVLLGPVPQRIRRLTPDQEIAGSNPAGIVFCVKLFFGVSNKACIFPSWPRSQTRFSKFPKCLQNPRIMKVKYVSKPLHTLKPRNLTIFANKPQFYILLGNVLIKL